MCVYGNVHRKKKKQPRIQCHHHCSPKVSAQIQGNAGKIEASSFCFCSLGSLVLGKRPSVLYLGIETLTKAMTSSFSGSNFSFSELLNVCTFSKLPAQNNLKGFWHISDEVWQYHFTVFPFRSSNTLTGRDMLCVDLYFSCLHPMAARISLNHASLNATLKIKITRQQP